jgi:hypothetical protein
MGRNKLLPNLLVEHQRGKADQGKGKAEPADESYPKER